MKYSNIDADLASRIDEIGEIVSKRLNVQSQVIEETRKELSDLRSGGWSGAGVSYSGSTPGDVVIKDSAALEVLRRQGSVRIPLEDGFGFGIETKALVSTGLLGTPGVIGTDQRDRVVPAAERRLTLRDLLPSRRTDSAQVSFVREASFDNQAGPQPFEGSPKGESTLGLEVVNRQVQTLAHWLAASRQILDDLDDLRNLINRKLLHGLALVTEQQLLSGDGTGANLSGLITEATALDEGLLAASDNRADAIRRAYGQLEAGEEFAGFAVVNSADWVEIELLKASDGTYIVSTPTGTLRTPSLWGRPLIVTNSIDAGSFLVGDRLQAEVRDRLSASVMISTEHSDFFTRNLVAIRAEERLALTVLRPSAFITGSFSTLSPPS